jgi:two-component system cell cycle sensor histidine kinase/response regulator CckA
MGKRSADRVSVKPLLVSVTYVLISVSWIASSDYLLRTLAISPHQFVSWSIAKGIVFVLASAIVIYILMHRITSANQILESKVQLRTEALKKSETRYRRILETAHEGIWILGGQDKTEFANHRMSEMLGLQPFALVGVHPYDFVDREWRQEAEKFLATVRSGAASAAEMKLRREDGSVLWAFVSASPMLDENGGYNGALVLISDIGERKKAEDGLRLHATALNAAANAILITDPKGTILWVNPAFTALTGYELDDIVGETPRILSSGEHNPAFYKELWSTILEGKPWHGEIVNRHKNGTLYYEEMTIAPVRSESGTVTHFIAIKQDVTARNQAREALRRSEKLFHRLVEHSSDGKMLVDKNAIIHYVTESACSVSGFERRELLGKSLFDFAYGEDRMKAQQIFQRSLDAPGCTVEFSFRAFHGDGSWRYLDGTCANHLQDPDVEAVVVNFSDRTPRKLAEEALSRAEAKFREIFENAVIGIYQSTPEGRFLTMNRAFATVLGFDSPELAIQGVSDIAQYLYADPARREEFRRTLAKEGVVRNFAYEVRRRDGRHLWLLENARAVLDREGNVQWYEGTVEDVTELRTLEFQLQQAQKLEAVGRLAGGVAHDFNNMLGVILGYSDILQGQIAADQPALKSIAEIQRAGRRAADLTRQLLAFSRRQLLQPQVLNVNTLIEEVSKMLRRLIGDDVELVVRASEGLQKVKADPGQLEQVIMNLAVNARDAMPQGGRLLIETANVSVNQDFAARHPPMQAGRYVVLSVSDAGSGMDAETLSRIFEPFFTTKELGKGTGLGLSIVYGIVKQSGGYIWADSAPGRGTTFRIYFPPTADAITSVVAAARVRSVGGHETILLVEDDDSLCELINLILQNAGYRVIRAHSGPEALHLQRENETIDLLLTDVIMPGGMNGAQLANAFRVQQPALRMLCMTGYVGELKSIGGAATDNLVILAKPFTADDLLHKIREVLDQPQPRTQSAGL